MRPGFVTLEQPLTVSQVFRMSRQDMKVERCPPLKCPVNARSQDTAAKVHPP